MKMVLLADLKGQVTDANVLAQTALKRALPNDPDTPLLCSLADLGLADFTSQEYRRPNGFPADVQMGMRRGECLVQVEAVSACTYGGSG
jgi:hypothetical protein